MNGTTETILGQEERGAILRMSFRGTFKSMFGKDAGKKIIQQLGYKNIHALQPTGRSCEDRTVLSIDAWGWKGPEATRHQAGSKALLNTVALALQKIEWTLSVPSGHGSKRQKGARQETVEDRSVRRQKASTGGHVWEGAD